MFFFFLLPSFLSQIILFSDLRLGSYPLLTAVKCADEHGKSNLRYVMDFVIWVLLLLQQVSFDQTESIVLGPERFHVAFFRCTSSGHVCTSVSYISFQY